MLFSSLTFIFCFLPVVLLLYFIIKNRFYRNCVLLVASLIFYAWGEPKYIILILTSIIMNYFLAIIINKSNNKKKLSLIIAIALNLLLIGIFKYLDFSIFTFNFIFRSNIPLKNIALPIGISFYTFQILSYIIDVYRGRVKVQKNVINLGIYIALFPQLIAGPIVRYETIESELSERKENLELFTNGLQRFILGLAKKLIIANNMAIIADFVYNSSNLTTTNTGLLWLAAISYMFQIYFDFSGYSDMAIGLGKIFGFNFLENFNYPYMATSITDFWRRWHISLSSWFKDYLYIPLGGNRCSKAKWIRNILVVWFLTGLWHGANWNFVIWGIYFGTFLILEKTVLEKLMKNWPKIIKWFITMFIVIISWVIFRIENLSDLLIVLKNMFIFNPGNTVSEIVSNFDVSIACCYIIIAFIGSFSFIKTYTLNFWGKNLFLKSFGYLFVLILFFIVIAFLLTNTYNPFIYFRF